MEFEVLEGVQEHTIFISCITPKSLKEVAGLWGLSDSNLYGKPKDILMQSKLIKQVTTSKKIGEPIKYQTDFNKFIMWISEKDPLFKRFSEILEKSFMKSKIKEHNKTIFDFIPTIFGKNQKLAYKYFYMFPRLLYMIPIGIWRLNRSAKGDSGLITLSLMTSNIFPDHDASILLTGWFSVFSEAFKKSIDEANERHVDDFKEYIVNQASANKMLKQFNEQFNEDFLKRMNYRKELK